MGHYEIQKKKDRDSHLTKNILPEYFENKTANDKLALVDSQDQSEDNININFLADDSYLEPDSFSNLDQEQFNNLPYDRKLSILLRADSEKQTNTKPMKFNFGSASNTPAMRHRNSDVQTPKVSENEKLLDAIDNMDDNLAEDSLNFSFARISMLDVGDRTSIVHGPSFKGNKESTERLSMRRSSTRGNHFLSLTCRRQKRHTIKENEQ